MQIAQVLVGFGAIIAFTRLMSAEAFGVYALTLAISFAVHTLLFTWAEAAAFRFFSAAHAQSRLADHFATLGAIALTLGGSVFFVTLLCLWLFGVNQHLAALVGFAAAASVFRFLTKIARDTDRAADDIARYATLEALYLVMGFAGGVSLLLITDLGPAAPFAGLTLSGLAVALIDAPRLLNRARGGVASRADTRSYFQYGAPLAAALALDLVVQASSRVILAGQAGVDAVGGYAAAFGLARPLDLIFLGVSAALAPRLFQSFESKSAEDTQDHARRMFALYAAIALPAAVGLTLTAAPLAALVVGEAVSAQAAAVLPWLAVAGFFSGFALYYWSEAFQLTRRTGSRAALMLAPAALQLALTPWLASAYGAVGAAIAAAAAAMIAFGLLAWFGRRFFALPAPIESLARPAAAAALMAFAVIVAQPLGLAVQVITGIAVYAFAAWALNILNLRQQLRARIDREPRHAH